MSIRNGTVQLTSDFRFLISSMLSMLRPPRRVSTRIDDSIGSGEMDHVGGDNTHPCGYISLWSSNPRKARRTWSLMSIVQEDAMC